MSTAKRPRRRQEEAKSPTQQLPPASKRLKTINGSHVPAHSGLGFLVDEDARAGRKIEAKLSNGAPRLKESRVDESNALVAEGIDDDDDIIEVAEDGEMSEVDSGNEDDENEDGDDDDMAIERPTKFSSTEQGKALVNGSSHEEHKALSGAEDADLRDGDEASDTGEPSFGEMLQIRHPEPIDVAASFPDLMAERRALMPTSGSHALALPSGTSLSTVLTQALKTNDKELLESCLQTNDLESIRTTIQRLASQHVSVLLQRLAERIHKRPGRAGHLMVWVQWSLVAHGGYLASQPDVMRKLRSLSQVIRERAKGLQPLLHLKGKLDMLSAQLELRRTIQQQSRVANGADYEDEEDVVYVEGQDDDWSDSEADADAAGTRKRASASPVIKRNLGRASRHAKEAASDSEDDDNAIPNGILNHEEDDASDAEEDDEEEGGLLDVEAEETDDDEADDIDTDEEADSDLEASDSSAPSDDESVGSGVKEPKLQTLNRKR